MKRILGNKKLMIIIVAVAILFVAAAVLFFLKGRNKEPEVEEILPPEPIEAPIDRKSTRLNSSHPSRSRMPSSA